MEQPKKPRRTLIIIAVVAGGLFLACLACAALGAFSGDRAPTPAAVAVSEGTATPEASPDTPVAAAATVAPAPAPAEPTAEPPTPAPPTPEPTATAQRASVARVGERAEAGGVALTVANVYKVDVIDDLWTPDAGNVFLVIGVVIENSSRDSAPYNPLYFSVKDSDGFEYNTAIAAPDPSLKSGELALGEKVRGNVAFEVRAGAQGFVVTYEPMVILGGYKPVRVDLGL